MSADNGFVVQRNSKGKFVIQHFFMSDDKYPNPDDATEEFDDVADAVLSRADDSRETEYGIFFNTSTLSEESGE